MMTATTTTMTRYNNMTKYTSIQQQKWQQYNNNMTKGLWRVRERTQQDGPKKMHHSLKTWWFQVSRTGPGLCQGVVMLPLILANLKPSCEWMISISLRVWLASLRPRGDICLCAGRRKTPSRQKSLRWRLGVGGMYHLFQQIWAGLLANGVVAMAMAGNVTLPVARAQPYSS